MAMYFVLAAVFIAVMMWIVAGQSAIANRSRHSRTSILAAFVQDRSELENQSAQPRFLPKLGNSLMLRSERNWLEKKLDVLGEPDMNEVLEDKAKFSLFGLAFALLILISGSIPPIAALFLLLSGVFYVDVRIHSRDQDRTKAVDRQLPDAVDVLVLAVDSGMNFQHALALLTEANQGPIIDDLARVLRSIDLGDSRATAFSKMRDRSTSVTVRQFVNALIQAESMGVSLAPMLREQGNLLRKLQRERAREQAQKIPVKILFPVMLCFVPALLLFVLGPVALSFL